MKLSELLQNCSGCENVEISSLAFDSRCVKFGALYFCLEGGNVDKTRYVSCAIKNGAVAVVTNVKLNCGVPEIIVPSPRKTMAECAVKFYDYPAQKMKTVAITGTNGKTTTAHVLKSIFECAGETVGIIGTNGISYCGVHVSSFMTTPDPIEFNRILRDMVDSGVTVMITEMSAHALYYHKCDGIVFDVAVFTNLSRDHLDFFGDMQSYKKAKSRLFFDNLCSKAVLNVDDETGLEFMRELKIPMLTYGVENPSDVFAINFEPSVDGIKFVMNACDDIADVSFSLPGRFNMYNVLCASTVACAFGVNIRDIANGIKNVKKIDGRFNVVKTPKATVIIDYAHTDDGLKNVLTAIKECVRGKIITVFGCGGNRDKLKRSLMGKVATELSDYTFITSDNPRDENPSEIIRQIEGGATKNKPYECVVDRRLAILKACSIAKEGDVILIAGKGAEKYFEARGEKIPYCDEEYVLTLVRDKVML